MLNKLFILVLFLFITSCGYEAIYSKKNYTNYEFSISELTFIGERNVNLKIKQGLNNYTSRTKNKNLIVVITSDEKKESIVKDATGDPTKFKITIEINVKVVQDDSKNNFVMKESFTYDNTSNKLELTEYENEIIDNLTEIITEKIIFKLSVL
jgi:hypothetical protein